MVDYPKADHIGPSGLTLGEETSLILQLFDKDHNAKISRKEIESLFKDMEPNQWTPEAFDELFVDYDVNRDGELGATEFWGWVNGHGGKNTDHFRPQLLAQAMERYNHMLAVSEERAAKEAEKQKKLREAEEIKVRKEVERSAGERVTQKDFIEQRTQVGLSKDVAMKLYSKADDDKDGDVDKSELGILVQNELATTTQVRDVFAQGCSGGEAGPVTIRECKAQGLDAVVQAFNAWDVDGDGTITKEELGRVLRQLNPRFTEKTSDKMMSEIDTNGDGVIDINEFVAWLSGENQKKKKMKKKAQEETNAKMSAALHRSRAKEARDMNKQKEFEAVRHAALRPWCEKKKIKVECGTLNAGPGASKTCSACNGRHAWLCHNCGFVSFFDECVNECSSQAGWSCIAGKCVKKCGCKKKVDIWQRTGAVADPATLSVDVSKMIEAAS